MTEATPKPAPPPFPDSFRAIMRLVDESGGLALNTPRLADLARADQKAAAVKALSFDYYATQQMTPLSTHWRDEAKAQVLAMAAAAGEDAAAQLLVDGAEACRSIIHQLPGMMTNALHDLAGYAARLDTLAQEAAQRAIEPES